ncbi:MULTISPECIES: ABC transporter ATP-binding protein [unclassified Lysinibacillus]|uniref:ABC transporter ATP-binding protein n=1 Tax=unclassified Lysinibacillus TaxID=2636778 RepID=UPI00381C3B5D
MLTIQHVSKCYQQKGWFRVKEKIHAVKNVSLTLRQGVCLAIVGESGSGKTTLAKLVLGLERPDCGSIEFDNHNVFTTVNESKKQLQKNIQVVFQDCHSAVNPKMKIKDIIAEPMELHLSLSKAERLKKIEELLVQVGLAASDAQKYPHQLSGGQLQRVTIARAISTEPKLIVLDESINSLDLLVQVSILKLLKQIQQQKGFSYLFITHDLHAVQLFADEVAVMDKGEIVEHVSDVTQIYKMTHPVSKRLLAARLPITCKHPSQHQVYGREEHIS